MPKWTKEQQEAIERQGTNIIVSAGAGSGKTAVLSERVIFKLENGIHINELLILTFTRAAAEEMKDRIRKKIAKNEKLKEELKLVDSAYITTFDSFSLSIIKKYHYLLNIKRDIEITDETIVNIQKNKIIDEVFEESYNKKNLDFINLINRYCIKDDKTLRKNILNLANKIENFIDMSNFVNFSKNDVFLDDFFINIIEAYKKCIVFSIETISLELENCKYFFENNYIEKLENILNPIINYDNIENLFLLSKIKLPSIPRGTEEDAKLAKSNLKTAIDEFYKILEFGDFKKIKNNIDESKNEILSILKVIEEYFNKLKTWKNRNDIFTFQDVSNYGIKLLKDNPEIALELKNQFSEIMIDEYQDTNDIQETFISMIANNNIYMVGDVKQSIYRFRGSNPNIFKEKYDTYSKKINGIKIDLINNFRSRSEVLNNINLIFDLIMDNTLGGANYSESHEMIFGLRDYDAEKLLNFDYNMKILEYENTTNKDYTNTEIEIFTIANDIKQKIDNKFKVFDKDTSKLRQATYSDFVIILDRSKYFNTYKKIFEYLNIPLSILKDDKLNNNIELNIIKNIFELIISIKNNNFDNKFKYNFISIARSFLYEYDDNYIFQTVMSNSYKDTSLFKDMYSLKDYESKTNSELFMDILDKTDFYNKIYKIGNYEDVNVRLNKIYDLGKNLNNLSMTIEDFKDFLTEIINNGHDINYTSFNSGDDSVKILTIHKSKGLEYPICYFADLDHKFNVREFNEHFLCDKKYGIIVDNSDESPSILKFLYKNNFVEEEIGEKIRLFYVALTRAREQIIIVKPIKDNLIKLEKNNLGVLDYKRRLKFFELSDFIDSIKPYYPSYFNQIDLIKVNLTKDYLFTKKISQNQMETFDENMLVENINIEYQEIVKKNFSKKLNVLITKNEYENLLYGRKIHKILEYLDFKNPDFEKIEDIKTKEKIIKFLSHPLLSNLQNATIYKEFEFYYSDKNDDYYGVIDLMLEYEDHIDIIDYKLKDINDENYKKQITGYKKYIASKTQKEINMYLYSIFDEQFLKI